MVPQSRRNVTRLLGSALVFGALTFAPAFATAADTWDFKTDYSILTNPMGAWSLGRKLSPEDAGFTLLNVRWTDGWYLGNFGHGAPSVGDWGPALWAKNNTNGLAAVRWTSPTAGDYQVQALFTGADSRGVDNRVYVVVNNQTVFTDVVFGNQDTSPYAVNSVHLAGGDTIDFVLAWNGGPSETGWTTLAASVAAVPEPSSYLMMALGLALLGARELARSRRVR